MGAAWSSPQQSRHIVKMASSFFLIVLSVSNNAAKLYIKNEKTKSFCGIHKYTERKTWRILAETWRVSEKTWRVFPVKRHVLSTRELD
jgi:hypothetical protein